MATITKRKSGRFQARVRRRDGAAVSHTFEREADAKAWGRKTESEVERSVWRDTAEAERTTLGECLDRYLAEHVPRKSDPARERSHLNAVRGLPITKLTMARVRSADVARVRDGWAVIGLAPATIVRRLAILSRVFNVARTDWGMDGITNPVETVSKPRVANARERRVSDEEIHAICAATASAELGSIVQVAVETGMRRGELCGLRWMHVDLNKRTAHLPTTKNGHARTVPLSSRAVAVLHALPRRIDGRVFGFRPDSVTQSLARACKRARVQYERHCAERCTLPDPSHLSCLRVHDLRHEATSRLADLLEAHELAKVTGHRDMRMVLRYYHPRAEDLARKIG